MIEIRGVSKSFGGVQVLHDISLSLRPGEVHAVCGENGAGKSTLNRILAGILAPDHGNVTLDGKELQLGSMRESERAGIAMVHQESAAFLDLTAAENHQLMREPTRFMGLWLDREAMADSAQESLKRVGEELPLHGPLRALSVAQRQMISIARAMDGECRLLILDEPTSSLSAKEAEALFQLVAQMRTRGTCVLYVSHRMEEIFRIADRVSVLRDGNLVATLDCASTTPEELVRLMVARELASAVRTDSSPGEVLLDVQGLSRSGAFEDVNLQVRAGEVVVIAGLVGAGRSELARAIFGLDPSEGTVVAEGALALLPEDRQHEGLHLPMTLVENTAMAALKGLWINRKIEKFEAERWMAELAVRAKDSGQTVASLSGGNQQKVLLAKWLSTDPRILILDEPTRGVDVGAKAQIHALIRDLAARGNAVLVVSSDLPEVLALADRILVMREGRISGELPRTETQEEILKLAMPVGEKSRATAQRKRRLPRETGIAALLLVTLIGASITNPAFATGTNLRDMLLQVAPAIIVGVMMTLVILAREIDISVGSTMGLCAVVFGLSTAPDRWGLPVPVGIGLGLATGLGVGLLNGLLVAYVRVPSIIATLAMMTILSGASEMLMQGRWIEQLPAGLRVFGTGAWGGVPNTIWMAAFMVLLGLWITRRTRFGMQIYAVGSNPDAAAIRGVPLRKDRLLIFALTGLAAAVAALFSATQLQVVESGFGKDFELVVIAAVTVGGTSILGGRGSIWGTVLGASTLGIISTVLIFLRLGEASVYWDRAIQGGFILLAVAGDFWSRKRGGSK